MKTTKFSVTFDVIVVADEKITDQDIREGASFELDYVEYSMLDVGVQSVEFKRAEKRIDRAVRLTENENNE